MPYVFRLPLLLFLLLAPFALPATAGPTVLFDQGHGQQFLAGETGPLDLSGLAAVFESAGYTVLTTGERLASDRLSEADVLIISGPFRPLDQGEISAVVEFVAAGGGLAVMLHVAPPLRGLLHRLEVDFTNGTLRQSDQQDDTDSGSFRIHDLSEHPLTIDLEGFSVHGAWALRGTGGQTEVIARTIPRAWIDLDRNGRFTSSDPVQAFGVLAVGELGTGRFAVFGDDALFQNRFLDADNRRLALNLARWLRPRHPH